MMIMTPLATSLRTPCRAKPMESEHIVRMPMKEVLRAFQDQAKFVDTQNALKLALNETIPTGKVLSLVCKNASSVSIMYSKSDSEARFAGTHVYLYATVVSILTGVTHPPRNTCT